MYLPQHFEETRPEVIQQLMQAHPFATLVTLNAQGINANHIPLLLSKKTTGLGKLEGHIARANPLWQDLSSSAVLAIFQGAHGYISPSWYPTKKTSGKVVPTWNYVIVHAHATLRVIDDAAWLKTHLTALTASQEANFPQPWALADAPKDYTERLISALIGIELEITQLTGKWKVSQNQPSANQQGVVAGLLQRATKNDSANEVILAKLVSQAMKNQPKNE